MNIKIIIVNENTNAENFSTVEELMLAEDQLKTLDARYQELKLQTPEWITDKLAEVNHEITSRVRSELMKNLRAAKARRSALRTADEKRADLDEEIKELEAKLTGD